MPEKLEMAAAGRITDIFRYPVKSMAGERIEAASVMSYGIYGDRSRAFTDRTKQGWERYVTARQVPGLLSYQARLSGSPADGEAREIPEIAICAPDGRYLAWDESLLREIPGLNGPNIAMEAFHEGTDDSGLLAVDAASLLIVTDASVRMLEKLWGAQADLRRFRPNIVVTVDGASAFIEKSWIGKTLSCGDVVLKAESLCERCMMIGIDPDTLKRDSSLLRTVASELEGCFGLYAAVVKTGTIRAGDLVRVEDVREQEERCPNGR